MKKITSIISAIALVCAGLVSCGNDIDATGVDTTYISMRINPEIEMIANESGEIVYTSAVNEDGEIVLSAVELEGLSIEEAGAEFAKTATEMGYVDEEDSTVYVDVQGNTEEENEAIREKLNKNIEDYFNNNGINGKVSRETLDKYSKSAQNWGLSMGHTKLAMRVLDANPELTEDEVLSMTVSQWMTLLNGNKGNSSAVKELKEAHKANLKSIKEEYVELFELRAQIEELENRLKDEGLTEDERASMEAELAIKESEASVLKNEYKNALSEARKSYKNELKTLKHEEKKADKNKK